MRTKRTKWAVLLGLLLICAFVALTIANGIQTDHGNIVVTEGVIDAYRGEGGAEHLGMLTYKLYTPRTATAENKAPGVLLLHGYQNDRETNAAYAIELARRGVVVLSLDEYGHGFSEPGLRERGYVNHTVKVNYGEESVELGTYKKAGGTVRYRLLMNFSNLSFFNDYYSKDEDGNAIYDSSCGGAAAYAVLATMDNVDSTRLGISGHSMGTWAGWSVAAAFAGTEYEPRATVLQCGELFRDSVYDTGKIHFNNVLLLQAKWDEFSYFRDYKRTVDDDLLKSDLRCEFLGTTADKAAWDTTFGSFEDGTARRMELLYTNHRLTTHNARGLAVALDWFKAAFGPESMNDLASTDQTAMGKEWLVLFAMLVTLLAMVPLAELLLTIPFFAAIVQPLPPKANIKPRDKWWKGAIITMLIAGLTYPFMTQLGHALLPLPEGIFRMTVGNGFIGWYSLLIIVMLVTSLTAWRKAKKTETFDGFYGMGLGAEKEPRKISWKLLGKSALLVLCLLGMVYAVVALAGCLYLLDLRFIWPFFKTFTWARLGQFCVYLPLFALFFLLNNSKIMASMRTEATYEPGAKGFLGSWWRNALMMVGGVLLIVLIEYIPFFLGIGPGADVIFGSTFGGPFMSLLILFVPQVLVFSLLCTWLYRRTGSVFPGALLVASLAAWIVTGGSAML
ncbi:MAG: alpha/beta hydrolase [Clostridia bacterium]|nr:alpha/beta hydrolase [Clostridia bacterium]